MMDKKPVNSAVTGRRALIIWSEHVLNRNQFPFEELAKYEGQHVAWSLDGKRILAGDKDPIRLVSSLHALGHPSASYVLSFVDFETYLGGAAVFSND